MRVPKMLYLNIASVILKDLALWKNLNIVR
ncbi:hypothetical protein [Shigella phage ESh36]|nr:hypothetical protein [Shigella phage ESh36]